MQDTLTAPIPELAPVTMTVLPKRRVALNTDMDVKVRRVQRGVTRDGSIQKRMWGRREERANSSLSDCIGKVDSQSLLTIVDRETFHAVSDRGKREVGASA